MGEGRTRFNAFYNPCSSFFFASYPRYVGAFLHNSRAGIFIACAQLLKYEHFKPKPSRAPDHNKI